MTVEKQYEIISALDVNQLAIESLKATVDKMADLNVLQMSRGLRSDGSAITPDYANSTIQIKKAKGQEWRFVTLHDKGDFYRASYAKVQGNRVEMGSTDSKTAKLEKKYSKARGSIFGLSDKYLMGFISEDLRPMWAKKASELTGLKYIG